MSDEPKSVVTGMLRDMVEADIKRTGPSESFMIRSGLLLDILDELGALRTEMERRDNNETRNCLNWGRVAVMTAGWLTLSISTGDASMTQPDLARLEGLCTRLRTMGCYGHKPYPTHFINPDGEEAATEIETLLARVRELGKALEPFAQQQSSCALGILASDISQSPCDHCDEPHMHCFQVRRARAALTLNRSIPDADR